MFFLALTLPLPLEVPGPSLSSSFSFHHLAVLAAAGFVGQLFDVSSP